MTCRLVFVFATLFLTSVVISGPVNLDHRDIELNIKHLENVACTLQVQPGHCMAYFRRYYYDIEKDECLEFVYGGCGGNENNFDTISSCIETCSVNKIK
ncbi:PI-actitoxin-Aeq3a-like isoform X2 [Melitaea cinxia]|uniref:PI-actitoxin-Aeq3a-like isoform X2 n=1 Tax=Melitaea cinxia TaxID=113334 RepID=UPI001E271C4C|nr:PI-actitoxin-Aeq3a-like isoform X2 [Melitaea cinxia]